MDSFHANAAFVCLFKAIHNTHTGRSLRTGNERCFPSTKWSEPMPKGMPLTLLTQIPMKVNMLVNVGEVFAKHANNIAFTKHVNIRCASAVYRVWLL